MKPLNLLITNAFQLSKSDVIRIRNLGYVVTIIEHENKMLELDFSIYDGVICNSLFLYNKIENFSNLKFIQVTSAGLDRLPLNYIRDKEIILFSAGNTYAIPMSEWIIAKILEIYKKSRYFYYNQIERVWEKDRDIIELFGKTATIIGYGNVGYEISKRLSAFGINIIAVDKESKKNTYISKYVDIRKLNDVLPISDIIILTLPLTDETKNLINSKNLAFFKKDAVLINVSRGGLINESDLLVSLAKGNFMGVALDTFVEEPLKNIDIWDNTKIIVTPHNSFVSNNNSKRLFNIIKKNLELMRDKYE